MSTEEYGLQLNITTNATEVQGTLTNIKKLLDEMSSKDYKINIDTASLKTMQDSFKGINTTIGDTMRRQVNETSKFINQMTNSLNKSAGTLHGKDSGLYKQQANEINSLRQTLEKYGTTSDKISQEEMDSIRGRIQALSELASNTQKNANVQEAGANRVSQAYTKMAQALMQIQNINTKASNYATKSETDRQLVESSIASLQRQKTEIESIMNSTSRLGSLTEAEYMRIISSINSANNSLSQFQTTNDKNNSVISGIEKQREALEKVKQSYEKLGSKVVSGSKEQQQSYRAISTEIQKIESDLNKATSSGALKKVNTDIKAVNNSMKQLSTEVQKTSSSINGMNDMLSRGMSYLTGRMMYEASAMLTRGIRDMISSTLEFNEKMVEMAMVTSKSMSSVREDFKGYNELAKELKVTTENIATAMITFVRQGLDAETAMNRVTVATQFAKAAAIDFDTSAELLTASFNSLGDGVEENFRQISDVLLHLGRNAGTSAEEIAKAMQRSASLASQSGVQLNELAAMISTVSERTRRAAESIGTSFASMMSRFSNMTMSGFDEEGNSINKVIEALETVNVKVKDGNGWKSYSQILKEVGEVWKDLRQDVENGGKAAEIAQDKMNLLSTQLAGTRQKDAFVGLMNNFDRYIELLEVAGEATGSTLEQYEVYLDSTEASINSFKASWEAVKLSFSDSGFLDGVLGATSNLMDTFSKAPVAGTALIAVLAMITKSVFSLGGAWKKAVTEAIIYNMQQKGMAVGEAILTALGIKVSAVGVAYNTATVAATAFSAAVTMGVSLAITALTYLAIKVMDTESSTRKLNDSFRILATEANNFDKVKELEDKVELYEELKENTEERLALETEINNLKSEVSGLDEEYKLILENENLSLETQLALVKEIARERAEAQARETKEEFLKGSTTSAEYDPTKSMWDSSWQQVSYYDNLIAKANEFNAKKKELINIQEEINAVENNSSLGDSDKIAKIRELTTNFNNTKREVSELGKEILKTDSQITSMNKNLPIEEALESLPDSLRESIAEYFKTASDGASDTTKEVENLKNTIDETTASAKDMADALNKKESEIDFIDKLIKEYKEYGKISIGTGAELIEKYEHLIPLLEDETTFVENLTKRKKEAEKEATTSFNEYIDSYLEGLKNQEEASNTTTEQVIENNTEIGVSGEEGANKVEKAFIGAYSNILTQTTSTASRISNILSNISVKPPTVSSSGSILEESAKNNARAASMFDLDEEPMPIDTIQSRGRVDIGILDKPSSGSGSGSSSGSSSSSKKSSSSSTKKTVEDLKLVIDKFQTLNQKIDNVNNALDKYSILAENANPKERLVYLQKEIELYEKKKKLLIDLYNAQQKELASMKKQLTAQGFIIDNQGVITNYEAQLNKLQANANKLSGTAKENAIERVKELEDLIKEFISLNNEIQNTDNSIASMNNEIYNAMRDQVQLITDMEKKITEVIKKQVEERKQAIDDELNKRKEALQAEKDAYNKKIEEENYEANLKSEKDKLLNIQAQIDKLSKDNSLNGKKKLEELKQQLAEQQKVIDDMVKQNEIDKNNALFDAEMERLEAEAEAAKEKLDEEFSEEKIYLIAQQALKDGVFKDVNGKIVSVQDAFLEFEDKFGDGLTSMGSIIKQELIHNLETAQGLFKNLGDMLDKMGITNLTSSSNLFSGNSRMTVGVPNLAGMNGYAIEFNAPIINIDGNVDKSVMGDLENMANSIKDTIYDELANELRMRGV